MLFNSLEFLIFLPIVFLLYWILPQKFRWALLLVASYFFYMYWNWKLVFLILFTTVVSYSAGIFLEKFQDSKKIKISVLVISAVVCLGVLLFFKYFNFFYGIVWDIIRLCSDKEPAGYFSLILPVGISFYTFQTLSYVIDVYKSKIKAERHFGYYALFVCFFPQLVAGPIERPQDLIPQLKSDKSIKEVDYSGAFRIMLIGFFKKIAVADMIGIVVNATFNDISSANGLMVLISSVLFSFQILCDFSGYSDIAVGCSKLFGINLTENFKSPYSSKSIKEFWNRWHISLSQWLRDYIYFPLGGSRVKKWRWCLNILIVFFISGLWHGASYNFVIWGVMHGLFQIIGSLTLNLRNDFWTKCKVNPQGKIVACLRVGVTFILVTFAWIFFRCGTVSESFTAIAKLFSDYKFTGEYFINTWNGLQLTWYFAVYFILAIVLMMNLEKLKSEQLIGNSKVYKNAYVRYALYVLMGFAVIISWVYLQASDVGSSFIYFQF